MTSTQLFHSRARGIISVGFFATRDGVAAAYPQTPLVAWGAFYGGGGVQLGVQLLGAVVLAATTLVLNGVIYIPLFLDALSMSFNSFAISLCLTVCGSKFPGE